MGTPLQGRGCTECDIHVEWLWWLLCSWLYRYACKPALSGCGGVVFLQCSVPVPHSISPKWIWAGCTTSSLCSWRLVAEDQCGSVTVWAGCVESCARLGIMLDLSCCMLKWLNVCLVSTVVAVPSKKIECPELFWIMNEGEVISWGSVHKFFASISHFVILVYMMVVKVSILNSKHGNCWHQLWLGGLQTFAIWNVSILMASQYLVDNKWTASAMVAQSYVAQPCFGCAAWHIRSKSSILYWPASLNKTWVSCMQIT